MYNGIDFTTMQTLLHKSPYKRPTFPKDDEKEPTRSESYDCGNNCNATCFSGCFHGCTGCTGLCAGTCTDMCSGSCTGTSVGNTNGYYTCSGTVKATSKKPGIIEKIKNLRK